MAKRNSAQQAGSMAAGADPLKLGRLGEFIGFRLRRVQNRFSKKFAAATQDHELRSGLFSSLAIISANEGISQNDLSKAVGLDKSITVQIIDELERRGLARRERSRTDRRRHALISTEAGDAYLDTLFDLLAETENAAFEALTPGELQLLKELLDRIHNTLENSAEG